MRSAVLITQDQRLLKKTGIPAECSGPGDGDRGDFLGRQAGMVAMMILRITGSPPARATL
jgi:hypothetical protein